MYKAVHVYLYIVRQQLLVQLYKVVQHLEDIVQYYCAKVYFDHLYQCAIYFSYLYQNDDTN